MSRDMAVKMEHTAPSRYAYINPDITRATTWNARSESVVGKMSEPTVSTSPVDQTSDRKYLQMRESVRQFVALDWTTQRRLRAVEGAYWRAVDCVWLVDMKCA